MVVAILLVLVGYFFLLRWADRSSRRSSFRLAGKFSDAIHRSWWKRNHGKSRSLYVWTYFAWSLIGSVVLIVIALLVFGAVVAPGLAGVWWLWRKGGHTWDAHVDECLRRGIRLESQTTNTTDAPSPATRTRRRQPECATPPVIHAGWTAQVAAHTLLNDGPQADNSIATQYKAYQRSSSRMSTGLTIAVLSALVFLAILIIVLAVPANHPAAIVDKSEAVPPSFDPKAAHVAGVRKSRQWVETLHPDLLDPNSLLSIEVRHQIAIRSKDDPVFSRDDALELLVQHALEVLDVDARQKASSPAIGFVSHSAGGPPTQRVTRSLEIRFVQLAYSALGTPRVNYVGGLNADGSPWAVSQGDAMEEIRTNQSEFYVNHGSQRQEVELSPAPVPPNWILHVAGDPTPQEYLVRLPEFPAKKSSGRKRR